MSEAQPRPRRWPRRILLLVAAGIVVAQMVLHAIPTTVAPPRRPAQPTTVFLLDYGYTSSLVLTVAENRMVAYVYGDWRYYALRQQGAFASVAAVLWPTQGALGRKEIAGPPAAETVRAAIAVEIEQLHQFEVERHAVAELHARLERTYQEQLLTATTSYGTTFVHHPDAYTYWSNSNHQTASWLRELGCTTRGPAFGSAWRMSHEGRHPR